MIEAIIDSSSTILLTIFLFWLFTGTGILFLKAVRLTPQSSGEHLFLGFAAGSGIAGELIMLLCAGGLLTHIWITASIVSLTLCSLAGWKSAGFRILRKALPLPNNYLEKIAASGILVLLLAAFALSLTPEISKDALIYHLAVPKLYLKHHGFFFIPGNIYSNLPFQAEMLYIIGLLLKGDTLAKGINFMALPVILLGMKEVSSRIIKNDFPFVSMFIFIMLPTAFYLSHVAYADLYSALYVLAALYLFLQWQQNPDYSKIILSAYFVGLAVSTKYSCILLPLLVFLGILVKFLDSRDSKVPVLMLMLFFAITITTGAPFYLKSFLLTGNPIYPFFFDIFGGRGLDPKLADLYAGIYKYMGMGRDWLDFVLLPWNISFNAKMESINFDGFISPIFLLLFPLLFWLKKPDTSLKTLYLFSSICFIFWATSSQDIRYMIHILPIFAVLSGVALTEFSRQRYIMIYTITVTGICTVINSYLIMGDFIKIAPFRVISGIESRDEFMLRNISVYKIYSFANRNLPIDAKVFLVGMKNYTFLFDRKCFSDSMFETYTLSRILSSARSTAAIKEQLRIMGVTHIMYDDNSVSGKNSMLSTDEKKLFNLFKDQYLEPMETDHFYHLAKIQR